MSFNKSKNKSSSSSSSSGSTSVWKNQQPAFNALYGGAMGNMGQNYQYGQNRYAGMGGNTEQAIGAAGGMFRQGQANVGAASGQFQSTMQGDYLSPDSNPYLQQQYDVGSRNMTKSFYDATNALGSRMEASGRSGGGIAGNRQSQLEENLATGLGDFGAQLYGQNYARERGIMAGMAGQAGAINAAGWQNNMGLSASGDREQMNRQGQLQDQNDRFQQAQRGRAEKLSEFRDLIGGPVMVSQQQSKSRSKGSGSSFGGGI